MWVMRSVALSEAKDKLSALVDDVSTTHEVVEVTKHGHPMAVIMSADDLESLHETLRLLSDPDAVEELRQAQEERDRGDIISGADLRDRYGLAP